MPVEFIDDIDMSGETTFDLFKGDPGTAKTPAACSWPEPILLDVDNRYASVVNYYKGKKKIALVRGLKNNYPKLMETFENLIRYNQYGTVIVDSFTTIARSLHTLIFEARGAGAQAREKDENGKKRVYINAARLPGTFEGIPRLEIDDYGTESNGLIQVLDAGAALWQSGKGCNVIYIAHVVEVENKDLKGRITRTRSIMTGGRKVAAEIPVYFNEAYHFYTTPSGGYEILTKNDGEDWAKTSLPIPERIDFTHKSLYDEIDAYRKGERP